MGILNKLRLAFGLPNKKCHHIWGTTHTNGFGMATQQRCSGCGQYRHRILKAKNMWRTEFWKNGKHPASEGLGKY